MRNYFIIFLLLCGLVFGGCKKGSKSAKAGAPTPTVAPTVAVAAKPTPQPTPSKPAIDQSSEVNVLG